MGAAAVVEDGIVVDLRPAGELSLAVPLIVLAVQGVVPAAFGVLLEVLLGGGIDGAPLRLLVGVTLAREGGGTGDAVVEILEPHAVREFEVDTDVLRGVEVQLGKVDSVHVGNGVGGTGCLARPFPPEPVDGTADDAAVDLPVETEVPHVGPGPGEEGLRDLRAVVSHDGSSVVEHVGRAALLVTEQVLVCGTLVTSGDTVGPAELEVGDEGEYGLEEALFGNPPSEGVGREERPAVAGSVEVRAVVPRHYFGQVFSGILVVDPADVSGLGVAASGTPVLPSVFGSLLDDVVGEELTELAVGPQVGLPLEIGLGGRHGADGVLAELPGPVGLELSVQRGPAVPSLGDGIGVLVVGDELVRLPVIQGERQGELAGLAELVVEGCLALQLEALDERHRVGGREAVGETVVLGLVVSVGSVQGTDGVAAFVTGVEGPVGGVARNVPGDVPLRVETSGVEVLVGVGRGADLAVPAQGRLVDHLEVLCDVGCYVALPGDALVSELGSVEDTVVVVEGETQVVLGLVVSSVEGHLVVLLEGELPVELGVPLVVRVHRVAVDVVVDEVLRVHRDLADVGAHLIGFLEPGEDIDLVREGRRHAEGEPVGVLHRRGSDGALLGGDDDDTVLGAHSVDGRGCVLQDGDALDVLGVELCEHGGAALRVGSVSLLGTARGGPHQTVDDDDRLGITAELEVGVEVSGVTRPLADEESGNLSLQCGKGVGLLRGVQLLRADVRDCTGQ